jgi:pimeloyl-ACP methyl ester carboxylesterase
MAAPIEGCKAIQAGISGEVKLEILSGVGHWHCIEAPEQVAAEIDRFISLDINL